MLTYFSYKERFENTVCKVTTSLYWLENTVLPWCVCVCCMYNCVCMCVLELIVEQNSDYLTLGLTY